MQLFDATFLPAAEEEGSRGTLAKLAGTCRQERELLLPLGDVCAESCAVVARHMVGRQMPRPVSNEV